MIILPFTPQSAPPASGKLALALGNFDGVHKAHKALLAQTVQTARQHGLVPAVFTFSDLPAPRITPPDERMKLLESAGISLVLLAPFALWRDLSPAAFIERLAAAGAVFLHAGFNFHFGQNAAGNCDTLSALTRAYGIGLLILPPQKENGVVISSSRIRALLAEGRPDEAASLLGRPYTISGTVTKGFAVGRKLSAPTINLPLPEGAVPLKHGVYVTTAFLDGQRLPAVTNYGSNPTFHRQSVTLETHVLCPVGSLYGKKAEIAFLAFSRPEQTFESEEALKAAIQNDIAFAIAYHERRAQ